MYKCLYGYTYYCVFKGTLLNEQINTSALQRCVHTNIRRVDRVVTRFYDEALASGGLSATQFALLATLAEVAPITINPLAEILVVDRTTLTRNLELLAKKRLIRWEKGRDQRVRLAYLTREGEQMLQATWPLWQQAQSQIEQAFGHERFNALLTELAALMELAR